VLYNRFQGFDRQGMRAFARNNKAGYLSPALIWQLLASFLRWLCKDFREEQDSNKEMGKNFRSSNSYCGYSRHYFE
jgi:hypothetical protein